MYVTGEALASRLACVAEPTCMRRCSAAKLGRRCSSKATISPSRIAACELSARLSRASSG